MREKLIEIIGSTHYGTKPDTTIGKNFLGSFVEKIADHLIANGVTIATDNNVGDKLTPTDKDICVLTNGVTVQQWIPVKERLPENHASCIVYRASSFGGHYSMLRYSKALGWHFYDSEWGDVTVDDVTHWMPLPDPPKGE